MEVEGIVAVSVNLAVACLRCRGQKLRCDRALPSCTRCRKQRAVCGYPPPPDRKRIAQRTSRTNSSQSDEVESAQPFEQDPTVPPPRPDKRQRVSEEAVDEERQDGVSHRDDPEAAELPPTEIGLLLLEIYFKRIYNASLIFHKNIAFQLYMQGTLPAYLLRAIFAQAAVFLQQIDPSDGQHVKIVPMQSLYEKSWSWARSASREVLTLIDEPTLVRVQALQVLQLYYYSQDETQKTTVHASLAYRLSQLLGYDRLHKDAFENDRSTQFHREVERRCFWATWCSHCIGIQQWDSPRVCERVAGLPLPAKYDDHGSVQGVDFELGPSMDSHWQMSTVSSPTSRGESGSSSCSLMAELIKLLGIWYVYFTLDDSMNMTLKRHRTKVQAFISNSAGLPYAQRVEQVDRLTRLFDPIEQSVQIPLVDPLARAEHYDESPEFLISVCSIFHLSRLLLHAALVPVLSGCEADLPASRESVRKNADMVLRQSREYAKLLILMVTKKMDITRLWAFGGYTAYVVGTVFLVYHIILQSTKSADGLMWVPGPDSQEMKAIHIVLDVLSTYWKPLRKWVDKLKSATEAGNPSESGAITSTTYPWNNRHPDRVPEDHGASIRHSNSGADLDSQILPTSYVNLLPGGGQNTQHPDRRHGGAEAYRANMGVAHSPHGRMMTENAGFEDFLMNSSDGGLLDAGWWHNIPVTTEWSYPMTASGMPMNNQVL